MPADVRQWRPIMTFSSTVMVGNRRMFWNVRAMPSDVISLGFMPLRVVELAGLPLRSGR